MTYAKLIEANSHVEFQDFGTGVYYNMPEIARGK